MKFFVVLALIGCAAAQKFSSTQQGNEVVITRSENENDGAGNFRWLSELSDGTRLEQTGSTKPSGDPENPIIQIISGAASYTSPEGQPISLTYTADEGGFQPQGAHIPVAPEIPQELFAGFQKAGVDLNQLLATANAPAPAQQARRF